MCRTFLVINSCLAVAAIAAAPASASEPPPEPADPPSVEQVLAREAAIAAVLDRRELLEQVLEQAPNSDQARWQAGYVLQDGVWRPFEQIATGRVHDGTAAEYQRLRSSASETARDQLDLANWCARHGLAEQERAHLTAALVLSDDRDLPQVRRRLGHQMVNGRWMTREEREESERFTREARQSMKRWGPRLQRIAERLARSRRQRESAAADLADIDDPAALRAAELVLCRASEPAALAAIELFARFDRFESSLALARQAAFSPWPAVRAAATETLKSRRWDHFVPSLLTAMHRPAESEFKVLIGGRGEVYYMYLCAREMADHWQVARYSVANFLSMAPRRRIGTSVRTARADRDRIDVLRAIEDDLARREALVERRNEHTEALNVRVGSTLAEVTGQEESSDPQQWWNWWINRTDLEPRPKRVVIVSEEDRIPPRVPPCECLAAGTPIWTDHGAVPVERIQIGDLVLAKDIQTGELAYKPVVLTTVRDAPNIVEVDMGGETVRLTAGHPVWASGSGWTRARELSAGLPLHTVTGTVAVESAERAEPARVYNLVVADFHTYFFGQAGILSHDTTIPALTNAVVPGWRPEAGRSE